MKLDNRTQALIAVGASVAANCQPCLQSAATLALEAGADGQQIADAIELGKRVRGCAASQMDRFALNLITATAAGSETAGGCECCA